MTNSLMAGSLRFKPLVDLPRCSLYRKKVCGGPQEREDITDGKVGHNERVVAF